jgi:tetratricopeptide (TPR) repeat protein
VTAQARSPRANSISLAAWNQAIDDLIQRRRAEEAIPRIRTVLKNLPRHLPSYFRLLQAIWILRRWDEGQDWALRLLRADPCNELAWAVLANAAEERDAPGEARGYWKRAYEQAPYSPHIRAGLVRTTPNQIDPLHLTSNTFAALCRMDGRWERAAEQYRALQQEFPRRVDIQCALLESLWRAQRQSEALHLAAQLSRREPNLLIGWVVSAQVGDETDQALAQAPLASLDADGEYIAVRFGADLVSVKAATINVSREEAAWFGE